jgi:putative transposase
VLSYFFFVFHIFSIVFAIFLQESQVPEFLSNHFVDYCQTQGIHIKYIRPGKPTQNAYIDRFNRSYREDVLDAYMFESLRHLRELSSEWQDEYNEFHPHQSLNNLSPNKF